MLIAVDFDGTIVTHEYPEIGKEMPFALQTLKMLQDEGHELVLWTVREGKLLDEAVKWCGNRGLVFQAINSDCTEGEEEGCVRTRKPRVDCWIDDRNVGGLPDWGTIYRMIHYRKSYEEIIRCDDFDDEDALSGKCKRKRWWQL